MDDRSSTILRRNEVLTQLPSEESQVFFGHLYAGSHEYTQDGFHAAQENARRKRELGKELAELNRDLGLAENSREQILS